MSKILKFQKKIKMLIILLPLMLLYIFTSSIKYVSAISNNISDSVLRLHVIANSDTDEDQILKYKVRDAVISYMKDLCSNSSQKSEAIEIASSHLHDFEKIALKTIKENGYDYPVSIEINSSYFPTKSYGDISLPEGYYDALKIKIGNASGQNWWCVLFPPLCFVDVSNGIVPDDSKETLKNSLDNNEEYDLISVDDNSPLDITFKFKLIELFNHENIITAKNN